MDISRPVAIPSCARDSQHPKACNLQAVIPIVSEPDEFIQNRILEHAPPLNNLRIGGVEAAQFAGLPVFWYWRNGRLIFRPNGGTGAQQQCRKPGAQDVSSGNPDQLLADRRRCPEASFGNNRQSTPHRHDTKPKHRFLGFVYRSSGFLRYARSPRCWDKRSREHPDRLFPGVAPECYFGAVQLTPMARICGDSAASSAHSRSGRPIGYLSVIPTGKADPRAPVARKFTEYIEQRLRFHNRRNGLNCQQIRPCFYERRHTWAVKNSPALPGRLCSCRCIPNHRASRLHRGQWKRQSVHLADRL